MDQSKSMLDLQNEVAIALVQYRAEDVRVISQPIARAPFVLIPNLERLRNLTRLELSEIPFNYKIEPVLEFIRVHDATHHTLKEIKIKGSEDQNRRLEPSHKQLIRLIYAMQTPQVVDARHWREAILVVDKIPADCLHTLLLGMADMPPAYINVAQYLSECAFLEVLRMPVRDDRLFAWAAANRRTMEMSQNKAPPTVSSTTSPHSPWQLNHQYTIERQKDHSRLRSIELCGEDRCLIPALRDATDAFRDSLEYLKAQSLALMMTTIPVLNFMKLNWSWPLTRLSVLDLEGEVAFAFDFSALRYCPELTTLRLALPPYMYSTTEDEQMLEEMTARIPRVGREMAIIGCVIGDDDNEYETTDKTLHCELFGIYDGGGLGFGSRNGAIGLVVDQ
ncbi:hypothetical protein BGZ58_003322 [Dissophora ornata]|nr:hypothetical protein BGZ58_003322 [Dissophora ornata]